MEEKITPVDLEALDRYLDSDLLPDDCMALSDLDGFLTGVIIGPDLIQPDEWMAVIWGGEEPRFASDTQRRMVFDTILGRFAEITVCFDLDSYQFEPLFLEGPNGDAIVSDWAAGFLEAVGMRRAAWEALFGNRKAKLLVEPLMILGDDGEHDDERDPSDRWKEFYASRSDVIPNCVPGIYNFWKDQQSRQRPQPRRDRRPKR
jgi:uncharacterized protein